MCEFFRSQCLEARIITAYEGIDLNAGTQKNLSGTSRSKWIEASIVKGDCLSSTTPALLAIDLYSTEHYQRRESKQFTILVKSICSS